jgi:subtilisin family serine protease
MKRSALVVLAGSLGLAACTDRLSVNPIGQLPAPASRSSSASANGQIPGEDFVAGQLIVRYRPGAEPVEVAKKHRAKKKDDMRLARAEIVEVPEGEEVAIAAELSQDPDVEFAEPDYITRIAPCEVSVSCTFPDGQFFGFKWDLNNTGVVQGQSGAKPDADMDWVETYDYLGASFGGAAVIGILDTGIRPTHQDFTGKILGGHRFLADTVTLGTANVTDDHGHGSHVAGIAAARGGSAVPGVAYGANIKLLVGKVCNSAGSCPSSSTANGIIWAVDNGANVINMSLGSFGGNPDGTGSLAQQAALQYAASRNVLPVCATGNDDGNPAYSGGIGYPARFAECMAVGATNWLDKKASYSNYGPQIDVSAPGGDLNPLNTANSFILSASRNGDGTFAFNAGTSMATPQVAGLAALLWANGLHDAAAIRARIKQTADDIDAPGWDARTGAGRINVYRAITGQEPNAPPVVNPGSQYSGSKGVPVQFNGGASFDPNGKAITYAWTFGDPTSASNSATIAAPTHTYLRAGTYTVTLTAKDAANLTTTATTTAVIPNIVPAISAFAGATLLQGESYTAAGSFADADPDSWTATVSYGEGGTQPLALGADKSFALDHHYLAAGAFSVAVTVSDDDSGTGTAAAPVTVWTPSEGIQHLLLDFLAAGDFDTGIAAGDFGTAIAGGDFGNGIAAPLKAAQASLERGNARTAVNQIGAFKNHVKALLNSARITSTVAEDLTARADRVVASINR